jgi:hypothetical protein
MFGKVLKSLNEKAKMFGLATDMPSTNRKTRRKELKENIISHIKYLKRNAK